MLRIDGIVSTFVNVTGLMEYQQYTVVVYAYTDKGRGEGSDPLMVLTAEHCKLRCKGACSVYSLHTMVHGFSILFAYYTA